MNISIGWIAMPLLLSVSIAVQDVGETSAASGVYTATQATRGQATFENNCSECHMSDLSGRAGPALKGDEFLERWRGKTVGALVEKIKTTMPADRRTQLDDARTLDVVAYLLQQNGFRAGDEPLDTGTARRVSVGYKEPR